MSQKLEIPPSKIEEELTRIWDSLQGMNKMRASLFNLIIYSPKNERETYLQEVSQKIIDKFPSRIIFVTFNGHGDYLKTAVSVLTTDEKESGSACDMINIEVGGSFKKRVPFLILPHILPDLPIYFVKGDDPCNDDPVSIKLESFAKRIIFDSETTGDLPKNAATMLNHAKELHTDIADLNWARFEEWRTLLAASFHTEEYIEKLKRAQKIEITYNCFKTPFFCHTKTQAIYLAVWLAIQMNWTFQKVIKDQDSLTFDYGSTIVRLKATTMKEIPPGRIIGIDVLTSDKDLFSLKRNKELPHHILIEHSTPEVCTVPTEYVLDKEVSGLSLVREICHRGTSQHFTATLNAIAALDNKDLL